MISRENLDKRICDVEENAINQETYREYIQESEKAFGMTHEFLDNFTDRELVKYLEFIDNMWTK